ncbi:hypothetical protein RBI14_15625 [Alcaligenaceae bacterium B3P038]|nr:hypothetical protein [Alcaligenaceae bacterium B3P038]
MSDNRRSPVLDPVEAYKFANERRAYELGQTVTRNNFFMVFQGVVVAAALNMEQSFGTTWLWIAVSILGLFLSALQFQMATAGRYQVIRTTKQAQAREYDLLNLVPVGERRFHFHTKSLDNVDFAVSFSTVDYQGVTPEWEAAGLCADPAKSEGKEKNAERVLLVAKSIMKGRRPSSIAIRVAIVLFVFWAAILVLQFVEMPSIPKIRLF